MIPSDPTRPIGRFAVESTVAQSPMAYGGDLADQPSRERLGDEHQALSLTHDDRDGPR
jgi:hypothetical protein